jgi:hypothetical protein
MLRPLNGWAPFLRGTVSEKINEVLIGHPQFSAHLLEVFDGCGIEPDLDLTLELLSVGILTGFGKIVIFSDRRETH